MKLYWPMATTQQGNTLFTNDACVSLKQCEEQFSIWNHAYTYKIVKAWVNITDTNNLKFQDTLEAEMTWTFKNAKEDN